MADTPRIYEAPCPSCGAPVQFTSAQATHAVCAFCRSTVVRDAGVLRRIGRVAELFDDHSPLKLGQSGHANLNGTRHGFTLVGRLQFRADTGVWNEWQAQLTDGRMAVLSEDNGQYVFSLPLPANPALPAPHSLTLGEPFTAAGMAYTVSSLATAQLISAEGELTAAPPTGTLRVVELRADDGTVLSWDDADRPPAPYLGQPVALDALGIAGLNSASTKRETGQRFPCPKCGAPVEVQLASSKSITCGNCKSLIDISGGVGGQLNAATQRDTRKPLIPLGSVGLFEGVRWQVLGFQHRVGTETGDDEDDEETFGWDEYLLYHRERGFRFLVDSSEGWSMVQTASGAPKLRKGGKSVQYLNQTYTLQSAYTATTEFVAGEFYWPVQQGQRTQNKDFRQGEQVLSSERDEREIIWSSGRTLIAETVAGAFDRSSELKKFKRNAGAPAEGKSMLFWLALFFFAPVVLFPLLGFLFNGATTTRCRPNPLYDPSNYSDPRAAQREICERGTGSSRSGSYGGYSSGGSHK